MRSGSDMACLLPLSNSKPVAAVASIFPSFSGIRKGWRQPDAHRLRIVEIAECLYYKRQCCPAQLLGSLAKSNGCCALISIRKCRYPTGNRCRLKWLTPRSPLHHRMVVSVELDFGKLLAKAICFWISPRSVPKPTPTPFEWDMDLVVTIRQKDIYRPVLPGPMPERPTFWRV